MSNDLERGHTILWVVSKVCVKFNENEMTDMKIKTERGYKPFCLGGLEMGHMTMD